jgi:hypothetical protein
LGSGVSGLTGRFIVGKTLGSQVLGIGTRGLLNGTGSGVIGGGVTLAQNAFNKNVLNQNVGLWDNVRNNAELSAKLGAAGSFIGDSIEIGWRNGAKVLNRFLDKQAWERMTTEQKLWNVSNAITSYVKPSNAASITGTSASNVIANSAPTLSLFESIFSSPNTNK